jgi:signal transduction histidine kinase
VERSEILSPPGSVLRPLAWLAWGVCVLSLALLPLSLALALLNHEPLWSEIYLGAIAASALVGGLVAARRPANPVGWLFLGSALSYALFAIAQSYMVYGQAAGLAGSPALLAAAWATNFLTIPGVGLLLGVLPLFFPTGRLLSPAWRPVAWAIGLFLGLTPIYWALRPGPLQQKPELSNPLGMALLAPAVPAIDALFIAGLLASVLAAAGCMVVRFRRSRGAERQQMKWLTFAVVAWAGLVLASSALSAIRAEWYEIPPLELLIGLAFAGIPVAAGVAVLRYRLYTIDRLISRTLLYGVLTAAVVAIYALVVGYLGALFGTGRDFAISAVATGVVAVLFQPLRAYLQRGVNRLLYGRRDDPQEVIASLGRQLAGVVAADTVLPKIVETLAGELKLPYAAIVLDGPDGSATAAAAGAPVAPTLALPLADAGGAFGHLIVAARAPDEPFTPAERRLLDDLARQAAAAVHAAQLTLQLQHSRERLVLAREEERRRLRNDLHDGLGPQLAALTLKLATARNRLAHDPQAEAIFADLIQCTQATIADVRRVVYALRPPALDELGLRSALQEWVARYPVSGPEGLHIALELPERLPPLPAAVEVAIYRIVQEAVTNVVRHARARSCTVGLAIDGGRGRLTLEVADDGRGIAAQHAAGVGLSSMRERAAELGGMLSVGQRAAGGTLVRVALPLEPLMPAGAE